MQESAHFISIAAGIFYLIAGHRLLRLSRRTRERPELLLGIYFAFTGQWYLCFNAPYFLGIEELPLLITHATEWIFVAGIIPYLLFIRTAFRPGSAWAKAVVIVCTLLLLTGATIGSLIGGFENSLDDPYYMFEWVGYTVPCVWMCCEGAIAHSAAQKRVKIGLCEPVVANSYLLFGLFGFCQTAACAAELLWAYGNSTAVTASSFADILLGASEIASVAVLWFIFFPPPAYRRWIDGRAASSLTSAQEA
jgi:hypothetical protein